MSKIKQVVKKSLAFSLSLVLILMLGMSAIPLQALAYGESTDEALTAQGYYGIVASSIVIGPGITVDFTPATTHLTLRPGDSLFVPNLMSLTISLGAVHPGLTRDSSVLFVWARDGAEHEKVSNTLQGIGIDPSDPNSLTGGFLASSPFILNATEADAGDWTLRVYIAGYRVGESAPIRVDVVDSHINVSTVSVYFTQSESTVTVYTEDSPSLNTEVTINLGSTETGLSPHTNVQFHWVKDGVAPGGWTGQTLQGLGIDPTDENALVGTAPFVSLPISRASKEHEGDWTLLVYIAGYRVGESTPIRVTYVPRIFCLESVSIGFVNKANHITIPPGHNIGTGSFRDLTDVTVDLGSTNTNLTPNSNIQFKWARDGILPCSWSGAILYWLGINPDDPNALVRATNRTHTPPISSATEADAGYWTLLVYIVGVRVGESPPIRIDVAAPDVGEWEEREELQADSLSNEVILNALGRYESVVIVLSEGASTTLSTDILQEIRLSSTALYVRLPSGLEVRIDPETITDYAVGIDLYIESDTTDNSIVLNPSAHGNFGFELQIRITPTMLAAAGLNPVNVRLFHIDDDGVVTDDGWATPLANGYVMIGITRASQWVLTEEDLLANRLTPPPYDDHGFWVPQVAAPTAHNVPQTGITGRMILPLVLGLLGFALVAGAIGHRVYVSKKGKS